MSRSSCSTCLMASPVSSSTTSNDVRPFFSCSRCISVLPSLSADDDEFSRGDREELYTSKRLSNVRVTVMRISSRAMNSKGMRGSIHSWYSLSCSCRPRMLPSRNASSRLAAISRTLGPPLVEVASAEDGRWEGSAEAVEAAGETGGVEGFGAAASTSPLPSCLAGVGMSVVMACFMSGTMLWMCGYQGSNMSTSLAEMMALNSSRLTMMTERRTRREGRLRRLESRKRMSRGWRPKRRASCRGL